MVIKQFVDEGLGNSSYLIASEETGLAAAIDPQRDVDRYLPVAERLGLRLAYALETHLHADFVSGARELAAQIEGLRVGAGDRLPGSHLRLAAGAFLPRPGLRCAGPVSIGLPGARDALLCPARGRAGL